MGAATKNDASPYPKLKRPATLDFLTSKPKPWRIVEIHGDLDAVRALEEAEKALGEAQLKAKSDGASSAGVPAAERKVAEARKHVEETTMQMLVAGVGRKVKEDLVTLHPPRDEDHEAARDGTGNPNAKASYNADTYPAALIAASLVEPKLSEAEVLALTEDWTDGEYMTLWLAVLGVNADSSLVSPGKASGSNGSSGTNGSERN